MRAHEDLLQWVFVLWGTPFFNLFGSCLCSFWMPANMPDSTHVTPIVGGWRTRLTTPIILTR